MTQGERRVFAGLTGDEVLSQQVMEQRVYTDWRGQKYTNCIVTPVADTPNAPSGQWAIRGERIEN